MTDYVEPPASELATPDADSERIDAQYVRDELAWLEGSWERADDWLAEHGLLAGWERVTAYWGTSA